MRIDFPGMLLLAAALAGATAACAAEPSPPSRPVADAQRWDLAVLYPTPADWDGAHAEVRARALALERLREGFG